MSFPVVHGDMAPVAVPMAASAPAARPVSESSPALVWGGTVDRAAAMPGADTSLRAVGLQADRLMLVLLVLSFVLAVAVASVVTDWQIAMAWGLPMLGVGVLLFALQRGTAVTRYALPLLVSAMVALQIQVSMGALEFHFGVFVMLALVMVYRDMGPILVCAAFFAVHHVLFDRLQAAGFNIYCTPAADFLRTAAHGGYVVAQTVAELIVVHHMRQAFRQGAELNQLVEQVDQPDHIELRVQHTKVATHVAQRLRNTLQRMAAAVAAVQHSVTHVHYASQEIATGSADLSQRTEHASSYIEETLNATQRIHDLVSETAQSALEVHDVVRKTAAQAVQGEQATAALVAQMQSMQAQSAKIAEIAGVVDGLAFQTNLLALNAAVEAAHAGDRGRGFAVVAQEVRRLAHSSTEAAAEIRQVIAQTVHATSTGQTASEQVQAAMQALAQGVSTAAQTLEKIAQASEQQQAGIAQINTAIVQLDNMTAQNAALAEQSSAAAASLREQMAEVSGHIAKFEVSR